MIKKTSFRIIICGYYVKNSKVLRHLKNTFLKEIFNNKDKYDFKETNYSSYVCQSFKESFGSDYKYYTSYTSDKDIVLIRRCKK